MRKTCIGRGEAEVYKYISKGDIFTIFLLGM